MGVQTYGGKINTNTDSQYYKDLQNTDYARSNYFTLNFNDMTSGIVLLFQILVVGIHTRVCVCVCVCVCVKRDVVFR